MAGFSVPISDMGFACQKCRTGDALATVINDALTTRASVEIPAVAAPC